MAKAKIITDDAIDRLLDDVVRDSRDPRRDLVIILLSCKGGLRAQEIAGLTWRDVTDAEGKIANEVMIPAAVAKKGHARVVPMHAMLREALELLQEQQKEQASRGLGVGAVSKSPVVLTIQRQVMTPNNLAKYLGRLYHRHGLDASSHSGRRTIITKLARSANDYGCSLFDVMRVAGHKNIETTEAYVVHSDNVHNMMRSL